MLANKPRRHDRGGHCREVLRAVVLCSRSCICLHYPSGRGPAPPGGIARTSAAGGAAARSVAAGSALRGAREDITDQKKDGRAAHCQAALRHRPAAAALSWRAEQRRLPAEGLTRLTIDTRVNAIQQSCVMAFLVDETGGSRTSAAAFPFGQCRHFQDTAGAELTRISSHSPIPKSPSGWLYKCATLILGAYPKAGGDPIFTSRRSAISNRRLLALPAGSSSR